MQMPVNLLMPTVFALTGPIFAIFIFYGTMSIFPEEKSSRHFLVYVISLVLGNSILVGIWEHNAFLPSILGFSLIVFGAIEGTRGFEIFFKTPPSRWPRIIGANAVVATMLLHAVGANWFIIFGLCGGTLVLLYSLMLVEMFRGRVLQYRFSDLLVIAGLGLVICSHMVRMMSSLHDAEYIRPALGKPFAVILVSFVLPMMGSIIAAAGLVLVHFNRLIDQASFVATHDELSGLLNRRALDLNGELELVRAQRMGRPLIVAFLDVDFFKRINDLYSHAKGDFVIQEISALLKQNCRSIDVIGRYGGEEFCIIFSGEALLDINALGKKLVDAVRAHDFGLPQQVTASVGLSVYWPGESTGDWQTLISQADAALYGAKGNGRDQYRIHTPQRATTGWSSQSGLVLPTLV
jgi:diguanylate cyclase (GGDEF)-like protein